MAGGGGTYTIREVAEILGASDDQVERMLARGEIEGRHQAGGWRIPRRAGDPPVQAEASRNPETGGPGTETGPTWRGTRVPEQRRHGPESRPAEGPSRAEEAASAGLPARETRVREGPLRPATTAPP